MSQVSQKEEFRPDQMYEEEFELVPVGQGASKEGSGAPKTAHPHAHYWQFAIVILCLSLGFMLGRLALLDSKRPAIRIEQPGAVVNAVAETEIPSPVSTRAPNSKSTPIPGGFVASKNGSKYYIPTCGSASRIKEENKIWFATKAEAEKAGYEPAANCPGL